MFLFDTTPVKCCLSLVPPCPADKSFYISQDRPWCQAQAEICIVLGRLVLSQPGSRPPMITGSARTASCCSGGLDGNADERSQAINLRIYANVHVFTQDLNVYAGFGSLYSVYAEITHFTQCLRSVYAKIAQCLRSDYAEFTQCLRSVYAVFTQCLRSVCAVFMQCLVFTQ